MLISKMAGYTYSLSEPPSIGGGFLMPVLKFLDTARLALAPNFARCELEFVKIAQLVID